MYTYVCGWNCNGSKSIPYCTTPHGKDWKNHQNPPSLRISHNFWLLHVVFIQRFVSFIIKLANCKISAMHWCHLTRLWWDKHSSIQSSKFIWSFSIFLLWPKLNNSIFEMKTFPRPLNKFFGYPVLEEMKLKVKDLSNVNVYC